MEVWGWAIVAVAVAYLLFLFLVASIGDRRARALPVRARPAIYALSLAIYCTSWTFFGSVGLAASSGLNFLAIYAGPVLMITLGYPLFRHIVAVAKRERITSVADFIAARHAKSTTVGALAAIIAVVGTVPYIALQLKAISASIDDMVSQYRTSLLENAPVPVEVSFLVAVLLAVFAILFGTRHADATEHQDGLIVAVATESIVKLFAFLAVGAFVTFSLFDGFGDLWTKAQASDYVRTHFYAGIDPSSFLVFTLLSSCAFILLPRQFHVGVVENRSTAEIKAARWLFPLYLVLINLFVIPVALAGMLNFGTSIEADNYVLALPLEAGAPGVSLLAFIGGLSAATAMVIVACVALAIMISNNLVVPFLVGGGRGRLNEIGRLGGGMALALLNIRRTAIFVVMAMAYAYFQIADDSAALASIGLLSFAAIAQFAPSAFIGLVWRRATSTGALAGMSVGFFVWAYTLFLPTILDAATPLLTQGPFGIGWLKPQALFYVSAEPLNHGVTFSLLANILAYVGASLLRKPNAIERMQAEVFALVGRGGPSSPILQERSITLGELKDCVGNYLGHERAERAFAQFLGQRFIADKPQDRASDETLRFAEQLLASAVGTASSRLVLSLLLQKHEDAGETTIQLLDDASEALQYNRDLLQTALDQVAQGICVFDAQMRLSSWNSQFRRLLELPEHLGQAGLSISDVAAAIESRCEPDGRAIGDLVKHLLMSGQPKSITMRDSGAIIEIDTKSLPDGGLVISWNDATERRNAARLLQEANETLEKRVKERTEELTQLNVDLAQARETADAANIGKTKFLAAVGHDILQPLNAARLYTSSLVEQLRDDDAQSLASNVDSALESVEDILSAVLAISRLDSGALAPNVTVFPADRLLQRLENEFSPIAKDKGLDLIVSSNDFHIRSDYNLLRRLLQNLVSNAIKYTPEGRVVLDAKVKSNELIFEVRDTGLGIASDDHDTIFREFSRLDAGKRSAPGLGLGLSIVKRLAETLNHSITLETSVGRGSVFCVATPLAAIKGADPLVHGSPQRSASDFHGMTIACLDNEERILDGMRTLLQGWGCQVETFDNGTSLIDAMPSLQADVVLADYHLDHNTGVDVVSTIRAQHDVEFTAILITADRSAAVRSLAKAADMTVLNKPLKPAALRALLSRVRKSAAHKSADGASQAAE
ncbi:MAG: PAS domain-containing hybrid sensor histidine kinase/response regulator [Ahrensia sp.]|nr:PAS domain-containing hybrid sensor histidine kinase/response regulator [Ahrensia sp.]